MDRESQQGSRTAEYMAFFRALETREDASKRLFADPHADLFLSGPLRAVARGARLPGVRAAICRIVDGLWPGARPAGVARTRMIDEALRDAVGQGARQIVVLGSGFDSRGFRLPELAHARLFEVDHPATAARKRRRLARAGLRTPSHVVHVEADLLDPGLLDQLTHAGFDVETPAFFLCEGVTNYLSAGAVEALFDSVAATRAGNAILFTYVDSAVLEDAASFPETRRLVRTLEHADEPWTFGIAPEQLEGFLRARRLEPVWDRGSLEIRADYWGAHGRHLRGYGFYRAALARVVSQPSADAPDSGRPSQEVSCRR